MMWRGLPKMPNTDKLFHANGFSDLANVESKKTWLVYWHSHELLVISKKQARVLWTWTLLSTIYWFRLEPGEERWRSSLGITACGAAFPFITNWLKLPTGTSTSLHRSPTQDCQENSRPPINLFLHPLLVSIPHPGESHSYLGHSQNCSHSLFPWCCLFSTYVWFYPFKSPLLHPTSFFPSLLQPQPSPSFSVQLTVSMASPRSHPTQKTSWKMATSWSSVVECQRKDGTPVQLKFCGLFVGSVICDILHHFLSEKIKQTKQKQQNPEV